MMAPACNDHTPSYLVLRSFDESDEFVGICCTSPKGIRDRLLPIHGRSRTLESIVHRSLTRVLL